VLKSKSDDGSIILQISYVKYRDAVTKLTNDVTTLLCAIIGYCYAMNTEHTAQVK